MMSVIQMSHAASRRGLTPASAIPLAYFAFAHLGLAGALLVLIVRPDLAGASFYHPKMVALVHVVTLGWLSGSILGAFYIVGPLALRLPMPARWPDWAACSALSPDPNDAAGSHAQWKRARPERDPHRRRTGRRRRHVDPWSGLASGRRRARRSRARALRRGRDEWRIGLSWIYGVAGLIGFLAQMVVGMQGRLVPWYAWYRAMAARSAPPERAANDLPSPVFALVIFLCWGLGVPLLAWGLAGERPLVIALSAALLLCSVTVGGAYLAQMLRAASRFRPAPQGSASDAQ